MTTELDWDMGYEALDKMDDAQLAEIESSLSAYIQECYNKNRGKDEIISYHPDGQPPIKISY